MLGESGYERIENDAYFTPGWCTEELLKHEQFEKNIWEPACGNGAISNVLEQHNYKVFSSDLNDYKFGKVGYDFLVTDPKTYFGDIITNPPYKLAEDFVTKALELLLPKNGKMAMLLRNEWDSASTRTYLFTKYPFKTKLVLTRRPKWFKEDKNGPRHNFSWFIWDWKYEGPPVLKYQQKGIVKEHD